MLMRYTQPLRKRESVDIGDKVVQISSRKQAGLEEPHEHSHRYEAFKIPD